jgi:antimicrobial peptide system SdpB family protein
MNIRGYIFVISSINIHTNVYGLARSFLAFSTLITLLFNDISYLMPNNEYHVMKENSVFFLNIFYLFDFQILWIAKWISIIILLSVIIGIYPRYTAILHWWISFSFYLSTPFADGGDHVAIILTLLLIPISITDNRKNHWIIQPDGTKKELANIIAYTTYLVIRLQVAIIYFFAAVDKFKVDEWKNGTAVYYWFTHPMHGVASYIRHLTIHILSSPYIVTFITWGTLITEILLFGGLFMSVKNRKKLLILGIIFHVGISFVHGLISFCIVMIAALLLFLYPLNKKLNSHHF